MPDSVAGPMIAERYRPQIVREALTLLRRDMPIPMYFLFTKEARIDQHCFPFKRVTIVNLGDETLLLMAPFKTARDWLREHNPHSTSSIPTCPPPNSVFAVVFRSPSPVVEVGDWAELEIDPCDMARRQTSVPHYGGRDGSQDDAQLTKLIATWSRLSPQIRDDICLLAEADILNTNP